LPKVASNCSTTNDRLGAVTAVSEIQDDFRFTPTTVIPAKLLGTASFQRALSFK
jgi:hypothetical protein